MRTIVLLFFVSSLVTTERGMGQVSETRRIDRTKQPQPAPPPSIQLPQIQRGSLPNGLEIMLVEHRKLPLVHLQLVVRTGADADPLERAGVARMTADMLDEGTATRSALQIAEEIDFIGARLGLSALHDGSFATMLTLKEHLDKAAELLSDILLHPTFPESEFDRLKKELMTRLLQQKDLPGVVANNVFHSRTYGPHHPYGYQVVGSDSTVSAMTLADVREFYERHYIPNNAALIVVGDVSLEEAVNVARKYLGGWERKTIASPTLPQPAAVQSTRVYLVDKPGAPQSEIRVGNISLRRNSEDFYAASLLHQILGSIPTGRLNKNLREIRGYTYAAYAQFLLRREAGPFVATTAVRTDVTDSSLVELVKEIERVRDEPVPEEEFEMQKRAVIQRLARLFETPGEISDQLANLVLYGLPDNHFDTLAERYASVTREGLQRVAKKYLHPDKLTIVVVGDKSAILDKVAKLGYGSITELDVHGGEVGSN